MNCVSDTVHSCTTFGLCFFLGYSSSSRVTGACHVTTDMIMRVNVRTATTVMGGTTITITLPKKSEGVICSLNEKIYLYEYIMESMFKEVCMVKEPWRKHKWESDVCVRLRTGPNFPREASQLSLDFSMNLSLLKHLGMRKKKKREVRPEKITPSV